jgi:thioredoxin-like negative regulator of GroEL
VVDVKLNPEVARAFEVHDYPSLMLFKNGQAISRMNGEFSADDVRDLVRQNFADAADPAEEEGAAAKPALRYEGKSFDEWRAELQNELSTKKRVDAVRALAAFGRAGYGQQASDAILDIAAQYDFRSIDGNDPLETAVLDELAPFSGNQPLARYWWPRLVVLVKKQPEQWAWLAFQLLGRLRAQDEESIATLQLLAKNGPVDVRDAALGALVRAIQRDGGPPLIDSETRALLTSALTSQRPMSVYYALGALVYELRTDPGASVAQLLFLPELMPLLFHSDQSIQQSARHAIQYITQNDAPKVVEELLAVLNDESRKEDHVAAVRALGAIGRRAEPAVPQLEQIMKSSSSDLLLRIAAGFAMDRIEGGQRGQVYLANSLNAVSDEQTHVRFSRLIEEEQNRQPR